MRSLLFFLQFIYQSVATKTGNDLKRPANDHKTPANDHKRPQTTNKRLQTTNKRTLTTSKQQQTVTQAHQTKNLTFRFFFPYPVITRNTPIFKNILFTVPNKWGEGEPNSWVGAEKGVKY